MNKVVVTILNENQIKSKLLRAELVIFFHRSFFQNRVKESSCEKRVSFQFR